MPFYAYVETFYDVTPPPKGWTRSAYTRFNKKPNHAGLASWASGAIAWSRDNCEAALKAEKPPRAFDLTKWRKANPTVSERKPPSGTPEYKPKRAQFDELVAAADVEGLAVEDENGEELTLED